MKRTLFALTIGAMLLTLHGIPAGANTEASASYNPARWSPLAPYIMQDGLTGPSTIIATDDKGAETEKAVMKYDQRGRLVEEVFYDASGSNKGKSVYEYEAGRPITQKLYNNKGELISSEVREYYQDRLKSIAYMDEKGERALLHSFKYSPGQITGVEVSSDTRDAIAIELNGRNITQVMFTASTGETLANISFKYDKTGKLVERLRSSPSGTERCRHIYNAKGQLSEYIYEIKSGDSWILSRKLKLSYPESA